MDRVKKIQSLSDTYGMFTLLLLALCLEKWHIWNKSRLDQPAQCAAGVFPAAILCNREIISRNLRLI